MIAFSDVRFTGYWAKFIKMHREGYKVIVQPLQVDDLDLIFKRIEKVGLCAIQLTLGSRKIELHEALFDSGIDLDRFFSSGHVKNGGMNLFAYLIFVYLTNIVLFNLKKLEVASLADILKYNDMKQNQELAKDSDTEVQRFAHSLVSFIYT